MITIVRRSQDVAGSLEQTGFGHRDRADDSGGPGLCQCFTCSSNNIRTGIRGSTRFVRGTITSIAERDRKRLYPTGAEFGLLRLARVEGRAVALPGSSLTAASTGGMTGRISSRKGLRECRPGRLRQYRAVETAIHDVGGCGDSEQWHAGEKQK